MLEHSAGTSTHGRADGHEAHGHGEGPLSMLIPVGVLTVLAAIGGLVVIPGVWEPFLDWIDSVAEPLVVPTVGPGLRDERSSPSRSRPSASALARRAFAGRPRARRATAPLRTVLEHKLYFDELYDALFSRPAQVIAKRLRDDVEEPIVQGSLGEIGAGVTRGRRRHRAAAERPPALVRARDRGSVVVLVVVFVAVR